MKILWKILGIVSLLIGLSKSPQHGLRMGVCKKTGSLHVPCLHALAAPLSKCEGDSASVKVTMELPLAVIQELPKRNITVMRGHDTIIQGHQIYNNFGYPVRGRWQIYYQEKMSMTGDQKRVLILKVAVKDLRSEDEFHVQVEVKINDVIWRSAGQIWFTVNQTCSRNATSVTGSETNGTGSHVEENHALHELINIITRMDRECTRKDDIQLLVSELEKHTDSVQESLATCFYWNRIAIFCAIFIAVAVWLFPHRASLQNDTNPTERQNNTAAQVPSSTTWNAHGNNISLTMNPEDESEPHDCSAEETTV